MHFIRCSGTHIKIVSNFQFEKKNHFKGQVILVKRVIIVGFRWDESTRIWHVYKFFKEIFNKVY